MEIHWVHADELSDAQRESAEGRARALADQRGDLLDVRIAVRATGPQDHGGREVRLTCDAGGHELVAARAASDAAAALDEVLDVFEREVRRMRDRQTDRRQGRAR